MSEIKKQLDQLTTQLNSLFFKQQSFNQEILDIKREINSLQEQIHEEEKLEKPKQIKPEPEFVPEPKEQFVPPLSRPKPPVRTTEIRKKGGLSENIEKFIGENLINKIGIIITVIGVSIGAKYAIDNDLISPLARIILGYLVGAGLMFFAIKLKAKYLNFSAVLLSGAMAILYFITYAAYTFYALIPLLLTFVLMVLITAGTIYAAIKYNKQIIAHIGMVGAYAVPFLLGEDPGNIKILLGYTLLINVGLLVVAFQKYWKLLFYSAFALTWVIFFIWFVQDSDSMSRSTIALTYSSLFYVLFYAIFLAYKLIKQETFRISDIAIVLLNSLIFFGIGYQSLDSVPELQHYVGLFTLLNAVIHIAAAYIIHKQQLADRNLQQLITSMIWLFITIAVPVQFSESYVTMLWAGLAAILFSIGITRKSNLYRYLSYPLMLIAFFSLLIDWAEINYLLNRFTEFADLRLELNKLLIGELVFIVAFAWINWNTLKPYWSQIQKSSNLIQAAVVLFIPAVFLLSVYNGVRIEIDAYWTHLHTVSLAQVQGDPSLAEAFSFPANVLKYKTLWIMNYSLLFLSVLSMINFVALKNRVLGLLNLSANIILIFIFMAIGLFEISELRDHFLANSESSIFLSYPFFIRYVSILFVITLLTATYRYLLKDYLKTDFKTPFELLVLIVVCWVLSSELLHWIDIGDGENSYKLGLSIFWGIFSLVVVAIGIWKNKKHLRIAAIILFAITLVKLFFYDIAHLNTVSKTIVFVSLGILLLIISFLYNKYTKKIFD